ncbi:MULTISPECIES: tRNA (adenosine(37)-N6)-threonylcarbamoyltransferase complex dimerization subunit type 1 TsaB [unclassified Moraxella]|uniref:tRNA (adenosine(37)-N6)-threonylcarbamoyltransferase complex dimerization subunit type 1 TsaB n=1 Tax=unclassified Moraxella TaxID=2685852 RepID=UPI00359EF303
MLVAFDTIFDQCAIAVMTADGQMIYDKSVAGSRGQTEIILPMLDEALNELGIDVKEVLAWAFNRGPGAFSGIRINTAVVQALSVANDAPCVGISSLKALAHALISKKNLPNNSRITSVIDARQNQVYAGDFVLADGALVVKDEYLLDYDSVVVSDVIVGNGADLIQSTAQKLNLEPTAYHIAQLAYPIWQAGGAISAKQALPVYLRHNAWKTLAEQGKKQAN